MPHIACRAHWGPAHRRLRNTSTESVSAPFARMTWLTGAPAPHNWGSPASAATRTCSTRRNSTVWDALVAAAICNRPTASGQIRVRPPALHRCGHLRCGSLCQSSARSGCTSRSPVIDIAVFDIAMNWPVSAGSAGASASVSLAGGALGCVQAAKVRNRNRGNDKAHMLISRWRAYAARAEGGRQSDTNPRRQAGRLRLRTHLLPLWETGRVIRAE